MQCQRVATKYRTGEPRRQCRRAPSVPQLYNTAAPRYVDAIAALAAAGVSEIDTSRVYRQGKAEEWHGEALQALSGSTTVAALTVSSKAHPMLGGLGPAALRQQAAETMAQLGVQQLDIYYLHNVDTATPIEETLR